MSVGGVSGSGGVSSVNKPSGVDDYAGIDLEGGNNKATQNGWRVDGPKNDVYYASMDNKNTMKVGNEKDKAAIQPVDEKGATKAEMDKIAHKVAENFAGQMFKMSFDNQIKNQKFSLDEEQ